MNAIKIIGVALILVGVLGLVYGGFSYTKETTSAQVGSLELTVSGKERVNVPVWAGVIAVLAGGILLFVRR